MSSDPGEVTVAKATPPRFRLKEGDIFYDPGIQVIPVNCKPGVMGAGLAKMYADRYPTLIQRHRDLTTSKLLRIGWPVIVKDICEDICVDPVILFPTKDDWRQPSHMQFIFKGLANLYEVLWNYELERKHVGLAFPALGCGLGDLSFDDVGPVIKAWTASLAYRFHVTLYRPHARR